MKNLNTLRIINQDADEIAMTVAFCGEVKMGTADIRMFLEKLRDCPVMDNVVIDFGRGHIVKASSVAFGKLDARIAKEELLAAGNAARVGVKPRPVPQARPATSEEVDYFMANKE